MDPQKLSQLDPKLRDAYQRVMGTVIPEPQTSEPILVPQPTPQPEPIPTPVVEPVPAVPPVQPPPAIPQPAEPQPTINPQPQNSNFTQMNSEVTATPTAGNPNFAAPIETQTTTVKKKNKMMPILFGMVGLIFIVVYALFWAKIFNFKLPFGG